MTKTERDKLREEMESKKNYISTLWQIERTLLLSLLDQIDALEKSQNKMGDKNG